MAGRVGGGVENLSLYSSGFFYHFWVVLTCQKVVTSQDDNELIARVFCKPRVQTTEGIGMEWNYSRGMCLCLFCFCIFWNTLPVWSINFHRSCVLEAVVLDCLIILPGRCKIFILLCVPISWFIRFNQLWTKRAFPTTLNSNRNCGLSWRLPHQCNYRVSMYRNLHTQAVSHRYT